MIGVAPSRLPGLRQTAPLEASTFAPRPALSEAPPSEDGPRSRTAIVSREVQASTLRTLWLSKRARSDFDEVPLGRLPEGSTKSGLRSDFDGFGESSMRLEGSRKELRLAPRPATELGETHAGLVTTVRSYGDATIELGMHTAEQLRRNDAPNPWEVGWLTFRHSDPEHFYYVALKPNGFELGKRDPQYPGGQRFLVTSSTPFPVGEEHRLRVVTEGPRIQVFAGGTRLADFEDRERPYLEGSVGFYTEDADARFFDLSIQPR